MSGTAKHADGFSSPPRPAPVRAQIRTAHQMAVEALAQDAEAVRSARAAADTLLHGGEINDDAAMILQRRLDREADAILAEAASVDATDLASLRCKGRVGLAMLGPALRRDEDLSDAGGRFLLSLLADLAERAW